MNTVFILLGSDLGNRLKNVEQARILIANRVGAVTSASSIYETEPWHMQSSQYFLNQCLMVQTELAPAPVMKVLLAVELEMGRTRSNVHEGYQTRSIDIDILYYNDLIVESQKLQVPHPRLHLRKFALVALSEIAPDFIHPLLLKSNLQLLEKCTDKSEVTPLST